MRFVIYLTTFSHVGTLNSSFAFTPHLFSNVMFLACMHPLMSLSIIPQIMPLHQTYAYHSNESRVLPNMVPSLAYPSAATKR